MNDVTRVDVPGTDSEPGGLGRDAGAQARQSDVEPEVVRDFGTVVAAVVFLLLAMLVTPLAIGLTILLLGLVAGVVMSAVGVIGLMPMLGPLMLALAIPAVIVAGLWAVLRRDAALPVTNE